MDAFRLRETVVADYAEYVQSFLAILDPRIRAFVDERMAEGMLWPDPLLQLSPSYQPADTVAELVAKGVLHPLAARMFQSRGRTLRLHLVGVPGEHGEAVQVRADSLAWLPGDGTVARDPIRTRRMNLEFDPGARPNPFFARLYRETAAQLVDMSGGEHTGQVEQERRQHRERDFRAGTLKALFCSPTMELGIDIADLNVVHFEMAAMATQRIERITSDEEERVRQGYHFTTHYRFAPEGSGLRRATLLVQSASGEPLMELTYAQTATLWRVNHRWRRATSDGFTVDLKRGLWARRPGDEGDNALDPAAEQFLGGVRIMVQDTRNVLLVRWLAEADEALLASLQYALRRGIETVFQVEEQELASERIGAGAQRRLLFWEAAEGGAGVLARLVDDPTALVHVAGAALEICHADPASGEERPNADQCGRACYRCLLSYTNQPDHALLDRRGVVPLLLDLLRARPEPGEQSVSANTGGAARSEPPPTLDGLAERLLAALRASGGRLPDAIRPALADSPLRPDFYFNLAGGPVCVFCDEAPPSPTVLDQRAELEDAGYRVFAVHHGDDLNTLIRRLTR